MNGYNFTERVRKVLALAREEAAGLRNEYVGTEHILLGIIREGEGVANMVIENLGIDPDRLRAETLAMVKPGMGPHAGPDVPYTSRAKKVLEYAMSEARELNHSYVGTEHLLLGLLREAKGIAGQTLVEAGITLEQARGETLRVLGSQTATRSLSQSAVRAPPSEPWQYLPEPLRQIVEGAYALAGGSGRSAPNAGDLLEAIILSSPNVSAAFTRREIEIDALVTDVRAATDNDINA